LKKQIPNILSFSRVPLAIVLFFTSAMPAIFIPTYFVIGVTDAADGYLARRFHWESKLGEKLEAIGDITFIVLALCAVFFKMGFTLKPYFWIEVGIIAFLKVSSLVFTRIKFKQWNSTHTLAYKYICVPLYFVIPILALAGNGNIPERFVDIAFPIMIGLV